MNFKLLVVIAGLSILIFSALQSEPSFNGPTPGCDGSGCHSFQDNDVTAVPIGNLEVEVNLSGVQSGEKVAGELVDINGTVVDVTNPTNSNPFILTAPGAGKYTVNAGYKKPSRDWDSTMVDITITSLGTNSPDNKISSYQLFQNYPNPFNPTTAINYNLPKISNAVLKIFNTLGQEVATLVNEQQAPGEKSVVWDGRDSFGNQVSSGVYIYRMEAGNYVKSRKMVLLR
jgi:flagellar hook assembly protein FlgD